MAGLDETTASRDFIVERLLGDTGEPDQLIRAARSLAMRALPAIRVSLNEQVSYPVEIELESAELSRMADARPADDANDALVVAPSSTSPDALILSVGAEAVTLLVSALFGGDPDTADEPIDRELSPIELEIAANLFEATAKALNGSGSRALTIKFPMQDPLVGLDVQKLLIRDGPSVRMVFTIAGPAGEGRFTVMMPQRVLLSHRGDAVAGGAREEVREDEWRQRFSTEVMRSKVRVEARIPLGKLTLGELSELVEGQVLELSEDAPAMTRLSARRTDLFTCEFGKLGQQFTVRVSEPFDAGKEFIDGLLPDQS